MPTSLQKATSRQLVRYEVSAKSIAARQHVDLQELKWATKYVGRNIERLNSDVQAGLSAITKQQEDIADKLERVNESMDQLVELTTGGFRVTFAYLDRISGQLEHMIQILRYPARTLGAEQREKGLFLASKGKTQMAVKSLQKAVELNECDFISLYSLGFIFANNQQYAAAAAAFADCALFADANPAMGTEAAILAAHCYSELGDKRSAWSVVRKALSHNSPDISLPIARYAVSGADREFATMLLGKSFIIDAELVIAAEAIGIDTDDAASEAYKEMLVQLKALRNVWKNLKDDAEAAGIDVDTILPGRPASGTSPQSLLMNASIYRRRLQVSIAELKSEVERKMKIRKDVPYAPSAPGYGFKGSLVRYGAGAVIAFVSYAAMENGIVNDARIAILMLVGLLGYQFYRDLAYFDNRRAYKVAKKAAEEAADSAKAKNQKLDANLVKVKDAIAYAERISGLTVPIAVPRAFSGDLVSYTY